MRLIDADALQGAIDSSCHCFSEAEDRYINGVCMALKCINDAPTIEAEPVKHGQWMDGRPEDPIRQEFEPVKHGRWIKMSDADGIYYACSECKNELPRVINSFNPQFDLFPKLMCIDKTAYCPSCGVKMDERREDG